MTYIERDVKTTPFVQTYVSGTQDWVLETSTLEHFFPGKPAEDWSYGGSVQGITSFTSLNYAGRETRGWDLLNYKKRKAEGKLLPHTPFRQTEQAGAVTGEFDLVMSNYDYSSSLSGHDSYQHRDKLWRLSCGSYLPNDFLTTNSSELGFELDMEELSDAHSAAVQVQAAAARIYSSGFDALTSGSEFTKVLKMFVGIKKRLINLIRTGRVDKLWLEGRYGWRTLIFDIQELNEALTEFSEARELYTQYAYDTLATNDTVTTPNREIFLPGTYAADNIGNRRFGYKLRYDQSLNISMKGTVSALIKPDQFSFNPVVTAWELVPFSFVIDWFVNVGQWIQALSFDLSAEKFSACEGIRIDVTRTFSAVDQYRINFTDAELDDAHPGFKVSGTVVKSFNKRTPVPFIPKLPLIDLRLDAFKVTDLIALAYGRTRR